MILCILTYLFLKMKSTNKIIFFVLLLFGFSKISHAQIEKLEEAKAAVDTLFFKDKPKALKISEEMLPTAFLSKDTNMITYFLDQAGELNRMEGHYELALQQLNQCLLYKINWKDLKDLSLTHNNIGKTHYGKGNYDLAVYHFLEALKLMEKDQNLIGQAFYLNNLAATYDVQKNYTKALEYYQKSLEIKKQLGNKTSLGATYVNLGITYYNLGDYSRSLEYNKKAYDIYKNEEDQTKITRTLNNMGECYLKMKKYELAMNYLKMASVTMSKIDSEELRYKIYTNLSRLYLFTGKVKTAQSYSDSALVVVQKSQSKKGLRDALALQSKIEKTRGNYEKSITLLEQSNAYNDSLINETNLNQVAEMTAKYEYEKNKRKISDQKLTITQKEKLIEQEKVKVFYWVLASAILIVLIVFIAFLLWANRKNAKLVKGQMALIEKQKHELEEINQSLNQNIDKLHLTIEEKEELIENVLTKSRSKELPPELLSLSKREMEVLCHLALGWSDEQLAQKLFVSKSTIKTHLRKIYSKLLVRGRAEAVAIAHKYDLIGGQVA